MEQPTLPPPDEHDLMQAAKDLMEIVPSEGNERVAQFLELLAPQMAMFASMLPPTQ